MTEISQIRHKTTNNKSIILHKDILDNTKQTTGLINRHCVRTSRLCFAWRVYSSFSYNKMQLSICYWNISCKLSYNLLHYVQLGWGFFSFDLSRNRSLPIVSFKVDWNFPLNLPLGNIRKGIRFSWLLKDSLETFILGCISLYSPSLISSDLSSTFGICPYADNIRIFRILDATSARLWCPQRQDGVTESEHTLRLYYLHVLFACLFILYLKHRIFYGTSALSLQPDYTLLWLQNCSSPEILLLTFPESYSSAYNITSVE